MLACGLFEKVGVIPDIVSELIAMLNVVQLVDCFGPVLRRVVRLFVSNAVSVSCV